MSLPGRRRTIGYLHARPDSPSGLCFFDEDDVNEARSTGGTNTCAVARNSVAALKVDVIINRLTRPADDSLYEGFGHGTSEPTRYGA